MAKGIRFWDAGEFPHLWGAEPQGDYLCVSQKNFQKKQFGYMWDSNYHYSLYKPERKFYLASNKGTKTFIFFSQKS